MVFYLSCLVLKEPAKANWHRSVSRVWMTIFLNAIGCPLRIKGEEHFKNLTNCIIVCNHNSLMDVPVTTPFMPRANKTIAKKSFSYIPVFGWIYSFGSVLVDRKSDKSRRESYMAMKRILDIGLDMLIYPEGTRNKTTNPLGTFHDGAFRLAVDTNKPVVPALLFNTKKVLPADKAFYVWPHRLQMHLLPAIEIENRNAKELKQYVYEIMSAYYAEHALKV